MIRFMHPAKRQLAENILNIPQKRALKKLIGFLYPEEINNVFNAVDLTKKQGMRDYTILHLLFDSGARASEITTLELDYFDHRNKTLAILGKGNRYRLINLWPKTTVNGHEEVSHLWSSKLSHTDSFYKFSLFLFFSFPFNL